MFPLCFKKMTDTAKIKTSTVYNLQTHSLNKDAPCTTKSSLNPEELDYALIKAFEIEAEEGEDSEEETNSDSEIEEGLINLSSKKLCLSNYQTSTNKNETKSIKLKLSYDEKSEKNIGTFR